jgi:hypothetical protein
MENEGEVGFGFDGSASGSESEPKGKSCRKYRRRFLHRPGNP